MAVGLLSWIFGVTMNIGISFIPSTALVALFGLLAAALNILLDLVVDIWGSLITFIRYKKS